MKHRNQTVAGIAFLVLFSITTVSVFSGLSERLDQTLSLTVYNANLGPVVTNLFVLLSEYGREWFWIPFVAMMLVVGSKETRLLAIELALLFAIGILIGDVLKAISFRARPFETLAGITARVPIDTDSSYPSGHALIVSIGAVFTLTKLTRRWVASLLTLEAGLVCYSRVFVGVHYPLDVAAGVFLGISIVFLGSSAIERYAAHWLEALEYLISKTLGPGPLKL